MPVRYEIQAALKEHDKVHNLALDWLIKSWGEKGIDKEISLLHYKKFSMEAINITKRINKMIKKKGVLVDA